MTERKGRKERDTTAEIQRLRSTSVGCNAVTSATIAGDAQA